MKKKKEKDFWPVPKNEEIGAPQARQSRKMKKMARRRRAKAQKMKKMARRRRAKAKKWRAAGAPKPGVLGILLSALRQKRKTKNEKEKKKKILIFRDFGHFSVGPTKKNLFFL